MEFLDAKSSRNKGKFVTLGKFENRKYQTHCKGLRSVWWMQAKNARAHIQLNAG